MANIEREDPMNSLVSSISLVSDLSTDPAMSGDSLLLSMTNTEEVTRTRVQPSPVPRTKPPPSPSHIRVEKERQEEHTKLVKETEELERLNAAYQKDNMVLRDRIRLLESQHKAAEAETTELRKMGVVQHSNEENERLIIMLRRERDDLQNKLIESEKKCTKLEAERNEAKRALAAEQENNKDDKSAKYESEVTDLKRQIAWYIDNQRLIEDYEKEREELRAINRDLRRELDATLVNTDGDAKSNSAAVIRAKDQKKIKELEATVVQLQDTIAKRHPNSIGELIRASKPSPEESNTVMLLQQRLRDADKAQLDAEAKLTQNVRSLRQEHEKMKKNYEKKISDLEVTNTKLTKAGGNSGTMRIRELEKSVSDLRTFYIKKVRVLSDQIKRAGLIVKTDDDEADADNIMEIEPEPVAPVPVLPIHTPVKTAPRPAQHPVQHPTSAPIPVAVPPPMAPAPIQAPTPLYPPAKPLPLPFSTEVMSLQNLITTLESALCASRSEADDSRSRISALEYTLSKCVGSRPPTPIAPAPIQAPQAPVIIEKPSRAMGVQTDSTIHPAIDSRLISSTQYDAYTKTTNDKIAEYEAYITKVINVIIIVMSQLKTEVDNLKESNKAQFENHRRKEYELQELVSESQRLADVKLQVLDKRTQLIIKNKNDQIAAYTRELGDIMSTMKSIQSRSLSN